MQLENQRICSTAGSFDKGCQCWHQLRRRASDGGPNESRQCRAHAQRARVRYGTWPDKSDRVLADSLELLASLPPSGSLTPLLNLEMLYAARCMYTHCTYTSHHRTTPSFTCSVRSTCNIFSTALAPRRSTNCRHHKVAAPALVRSASTYCLSKRPVT